MIETSLWFELMMPILLNVYSCKAMKLFIHMFSVYNSEYVL